MGKFDIRSQVAAAVIEHRDIEVITAEILALKQNAGESILGIGRCLIEAKEALPHGEWSAWLSERVEFSERTAQNFMRLSREWSNPQALADLGATKALTLLALPAEEREQFVIEAHVVDGEEKTVADMTSRELQEAIKAKEQAEADAKASEEARAKISEDMALTKQLLDAAKADRDAAAKRAAELEKELAELKAKPVDVAIATADRETIDKAKAEAVADMQAKLDKAKEAKTKAEEKRKEAEEELSVLREKLESAEKAARKAAMTADKDMAAFEVLFNQGQELANKMQGLLIKARGREATDAAGAIQKAMVALARAIEEAAK